MQMGGYVQHACQVLQIRQVPIVQAQDMMVHLEGMAIHREQQCRMLKQSEEHLQGLLTESRQGVAHVQQTLTEVRGKKTAAAAAHKRALRDKERKVDEVRVCLDVRTHESSLLGSAVDLAICSLEAACLA